MKRKPRGAYTEWDIHDETLRNSYHTIRVRRLSKIIGCSENAIYQRAKVLGLRKNKIKEHGNSL